MSLIFPAFSTSALFLASAVATAAAAGDGAYLATVGPPELRFAPPRTLTNSRPVLPPLMPVAVTPSQPRPTEVPFATSAPMAPIPSPANVPAEPHLDPLGDSILSAATGEAPVTADPLTGAGPLLPQPQMFLHYFTPEYMGGSNFVSMALPVGFAPPQPRVSSSATYEVTPSPPPKP